MAIPTSFNEAGCHPVVVNIEYNASSVDKISFVADRAYRVRSVTPRVTVQASSGPTTAVVKKAPSATGIASGTAVHASTINLAGTNDTNQSIGLSTTTADTALAAGDALGVDFTGTMTAATGVITVVLDPI